MAAVQEEIQWPVGKYKERNLRPIFLSSLLLQGMVYSSVYQSEEGETNLRYSHSIVAASLLPVQLYLWMLALYLEKQRFGKSVMYFRCLSIFIGMAFLQYSLIVAVLKL